MPVPQSVELMPVYFSRAFFDCFRSDRSRSSSARNSISSFTRCRTAAPSRLVAVEEGGEEGVGTVDALVLALLVREGVVLELAEVEAVLPGVRHHALAPVLHQVRQQNQRLQPRFASSSGVAVK